MQDTVGPDGAELGEYWFAGGAAMSPAVETWFGLDAVGRALGLMLLGVVLYRVGIVQGDRDDAYYRRLAGWGLAVGTAITTVRIVLRSLSDGSPDVAIVGHIPTGVGTIPMVLGYLAVIVLFDRSGSRHLVRVRNAGRMALTTYLMQTILGLTHRKAAWTATQPGRMMLAGAHRPVVSGRRLRNDDRRDTETCRGAACRR